MKPQRRTQAARVRPTKKVRKQTTPQQIRAHVQEMYAVRQAEWLVQLLVDECPDWNSLLGLHLQMTELERLQTGIEELF